jgi:arsenate reductase
MKKIYYLKTCDTNKRILKQIKNIIGKEKFDSFTFQEIKEQPITVNQLEQMYNLSGNYESLFSKRAKKYKQMDLKFQNLSEKDYKQLILDEYTFLKRPVIILNNSIFIGNNKKNIENLLQTIN